MKKRHYILAVIFIVSGCTFQEPDYLKAITAELN